MLGIHVAILFVTFMTIVRSDYEGVAYMRGTKQTLDPTFVKRLHYAVWAGLLGMIVTGLIMVVPAWSFYSTDPIFLLKMFFVGVLVLNSLLIHSIMHVATTTPFAQLLSTQKVKLLTTGTASVIGWIGVIIIGMFFL